MRTFRKPYDFTFLPSREPELNLNISGDRRVEQLDDLAPSTQYEMQVCAVTEAGIGQCRVELFYTAPANSAACKL